MLPRWLYELLPYIYITTGVSSALLIDSRLIMIASILMVMAGVIVFALRISSRRTHERRPASIPAAGNPGRCGYTKRSGQDRRRQPAAGFPLVDASGQRIEHDRRASERRLSPA